jgi:hypothetical protein
MIVAIVLAVLFVAAGVVAGVEASGKSTAQRDFRDERRMLAVAEMRLADANSTKASQSSQLAAYKTCITDLNILFASTDGTPAAVAADKQAQKDCIPLGLG